MRLTHRTRHAVCSCAKLALFVGVFVQTLAHRLRDHATNARQPCARLSSRFTTGTSFRARPSLIALSIHHLPAVKAFERRRGTELALAATMLASAPHVGPIEEFMSADHVRLDRLLTASEAPDGSIDAAAYAQFRQGLLQHIAMEEKVLLPYARAKRGGHPLPIARSLRADHGQIAKLLVRSPSSVIVASLRRLLGQHNQLEEGRVGLYATCDELARDEAPIVIAQLRVQPTVPVAKYYDGPLHEKR